MHNRRARHTMAIDKSNGSGEIALKALEGYLSEFGVTLPESAVSFVGSIPPPNRPAVRSSIFPLSEMSPLSPMQQ